MMEIRGGTGARVRQIGDVASVEFIRRIIRDHPWRCILTQDGLEVELGLVNEMEPFIGGRPMSGVLPDGRLDPRGVPTLALPAAGPYPYWICIRVVVNADGKLLPANYSANTLSIVVSRANVSTDPLVGLRAIAVMRLRDGAPDLHQIGKFDYEHLTSRTRAGRVRHHWQIT